MVESTSDLCLVPFCTIEKVFVPVPPLPIVEEGTIDDVNPELKEEIPINTTPSPPKTTGVLPTT